MARSKNYDRQAVIEQITKVFLAKGYESTSMADLMLCTGLNKKSLYNEFGNKQAMFIVILASFIEKERSCVAPIFTREPLGLANIRAFYQHILNEFSETGCLLTLSINEASCIPEQALEMVNQSFLGLEQGIAANLAACLGDSKQTEMFARNMLSLMLGYASLTRSPALRLNNEQQLNALLDFIEQNAC
ncbi:transcriptional regulator [Catenovulum agarivorans DS-2]|uniref:Transcriptional regulator n=1 Tax=Catenovulum agarivorans DS-2 TaxID=1328313 RepID=W7QCW5_9ALTE|nr:TetR/AcrR family transcriptional regulator [Catenovulum agarivorans]EWH09761.1 transcriptional regulator [Catenovulum agarivorans DS-2]